MRFLNPCPIRFPRFYRFFPKAERTGFLHRWPSRISILTNGHPTIVTWTTMKACSCIADQGGGRGAGMLSHVPQGILHGADEVARAAFQKRRVPGMRRLFTGGSVDTDRSLVASKAFRRLSE